MKISNLPILRWINRSRKASTPVTSVESYASIAELSEAAADKIVATANSAIAERDEFTIALAGGSTPKKLYELLTTSSWSSKTDWSKWSFLFSDERVVPLDDDRSNFKMANDAMLAPLRIDPSRIYAIDPSLGSAEAVAAKYESDVRAVIDSGAKQIDLVLLGLGSDGHTASLFPGKEALTVSDRLVVPSSPGVLPPPVDRITFTYPLLNAARNVMFLVAGADKKNALDSSLNGPVLDGGTVAPAAAVEPKSGNLIWLVEASLVES